MNNNKSKYLGVLLAVLMLATAVPGFLVPVSAAAPTSISATVGTNYPNNKIFAGLPVNISLNVTYDQPANSYVRVTVYYNEISTATKLYETPDGNIPGFPVTNGTAHIELPELRFPQEAETAIIVLYDPLYEITANETLPVLFPYNVTYTVTSAVPYYNTTWKYDMAFKEIPFNLTVNVTYDPDSSVGAPSNVTAIVYLPDGTDNTTIISLTNGIGSVTFENLISNSIGTVEITVADTINKLTKTISGPEVHNWWIEFDVNYTTDFSLTYPPYAKLPFNITGNVIAYTDFGALLSVNDNVYIELAENSTYNTTTTMINGNASFSMSDITLEEGGTYYLYANMSMYSPTATLEFNITSWDINITPTITCDGVECAYFYVGLNQTLNITVNYPVSPYNIASTANYSILLNDVEIHNGTINVVNNTGEVIIPVNFNESGVVTIEVWDENYQEFNSVTIEVREWGLDYDYTVTHYPDTYFITDDKFYVGIPASLTLDVIYTQPCPINATVNITLQLPNGTVLTNSTVVSDDTSTIFTFPETFLFKEPGFVVVTYTDSFDKSVSFKIPVKDWGIFVDVSPEELIQGESVNFNVFVAESLYFGDTWESGPGSRDVTVTIELPDGYVETKNLTLEQNDDWYSGQGGYQGIVTFENVTPQMPGLAWVTVTDVLSGKTVRMPVEVKVPEDYVGKVIQVTATPESTPVYKYIPNAMEITIEYYNRDANGGLTPDNGPHYMRILVYDADGSTVIVNTTASTNEYMYILPVDEIPVNGLTPIAIHVIDLTNTSIRGTTTIPVTDWSAIINIEDVTVWKYVDNTLTVSVEPTNGVPLTAADLNVTVSTNYGSDNGMGEVTISLTDPTENVTGTVEVYYKDYLINSTTINIPVTPWNATITVIPDKIYWGISTDVTVNAEPTDSHPDEDVPVTAADLNVTVSTNYGSDNGMGEVTISLTDPTENVTGTVEVYYKDYLINTVAIFIPVEEWAVNVDYEPKTFYYLPNGYANEPLVGSVVLDLPASIASAANITFEASLPTLGIGGGSSGSNTFTFDFTWAPEKFVFNSSGVVPLVVKLYDPATNFTYFEETYEIPIELALDAEISGTYYEDVPTDFVIYVESISDNPNITVTINDTDYTTTVDQDGEIIIEDVTLDAGNYTVIISDASLGATITRTFEVREWYIEVNVIPDEIVAGAAWNVYSEVRTIDSTTNETAPISGPVDITIEFSDETIIRPDSRPVELVNGMAEFRKVLIAPVPGNYSITATIYNHTDALVLNVRAPEPNEVAWVYANIRIENTTETPDEPTVIYISWADAPLERPDIPYYPVYDPITGELVKADAGEDEVAFRVYAGGGEYEWAWWQWGYVIAVPENVHNALEVPEIRDGEVIRPVADTYADYEHSVTSNGYYNWTITVTADKYDVTYVYKPPMYPGLLYIEQASSSFQINAIYVGATTETELADSLTNFTTIEIVPDNLTLSLLDETDKKLIKEGEEGPEFTIQALLRIMNASEQFEEQFAPFEEWIMDIDFLSEEQKAEIITNITAQIGELPSEPVPYPNATIEFYHTNSAIADLIPENATTDESGTATVTVKSKATADMLPEELAQLVGSTTVSATYGALPSSNNITVTFLGTGSVSGDVTDITGMQIPGAKVYLKIKVNGTWVNATDYYGNQLITQSAEDGHYSIDNIPVYSSEGTEYLVVAEFSETKGYAYVTVKPFVTATADVKLTGEVPSTGLAIYKQKVQQAEHVYVVYGSDALSSDSFAISAYIAQTVPPEKFLMRTDAQLDMSALTDKDVVVSVGGPAVNEVTAAFEPVAPVHMVLGENITIVTPKGNLTWSAPEVWYNVTEGYFIIQLFEDNETGALVVTIYGTDADSTLAGAYYFANTIYPNLADYAEVSWIVGKWTDSDAGEPVVILDPADDSGFNPADTITIVYKG
ncbi:carboxypeptidase-like regulatory domain-containing protein [Thermococcus aggregans]|uniref:Carboxypeptidase-like regulatory domain-containing protein n=1 Tax=Thermococcus aggregans TaxID=110163 RepID=A0A9E7SP57_THEAG|nr:carboxypeptidase-like regulatory domain-containing protein [Thermococcus aggregans]USS41094.1 carboxypeptidase-like regulatory domain-containing protein [Thermococcus aggregans]